jgi:hypothetical protein
MKRKTEPAELKTQVKHNTLHKVTARGGKGSKMVANQTKQSLRITWVKTTHYKYHTGFPVSNISAAHLSLGGWLFFNRNPVIRVPGLFSVLMCI